MKTQLFGTDGIRGLVGQYPLDAVGAQQIGKAIASHFARPGEVIMIGSDPRESSADLVTAVSAGITAMGVHVLNVGVVPTPGLAYLTSQETEAKAGVMITASHNPYTDNGIKVFTADGGKLSDSIQDSLNTLINSQIADEGIGVATDEPGRVGDYEAFLVDSAIGSPFDGLRFALDCANGAASAIAVQVFEKLGAIVVPLFDHPDGKNINAQCGTTDTAALEQAVQQRALDAGAAFDGDADRVALIDGKGRRLSGDHLLYILAITGHHRGVVATDMSNGGLELALRKRGIDLHRTAVGDRYVLEGLAETGYKLGGEQSGHIIQTTFSTTGDGLLAAVQTLQQVRSSGKSLAKWYDELTLLPQELLNISLADQNLLNDPGVVSYLAAQIIDLGDNGRLITRASGTEPKLRIMVEAPDAPKRAKAIAEQLSALLTAAGAKA
jgi:phosphoglucosamine mutase